MTSLTSKCLATILNTVTSIIKRGTVTRPIADGDGSAYPVVQCKYLNKVTSAEVLAPYGYSYNPPLNSLGVLWNILAQEENKSGIFTDPPNRFKNLEPGEIQLGSFVTKSSIKFDKDKNIIMDSKNDIKVTATNDINMKADNDVKIEASNDLNLKGNNVIIDANQVTINSDVQINGSLTVSGEVTAGAGIQLTTHVHPGVESGPDTTGAPI